MKAIQIVLDEDECNYIIAALRYAADERTHDANRRKHFYGIEAWKKKHSEAARWRALADRLEAATR